MHKRVGLRKILFKEDIRVPLSEIYSVISANSVLSDVETLLAIAPFYLRYNVTLRSSYDVFIDLKINYRIKNNFKMLYSQCCLCHVHFRYNFEYLLKLYTNLIRLINTKKTISYAVHSQKSIMIDENNFY